MDGSYRQAGLIIIEFCGRISCKPVWVSHRSQFLTHFQKMRDSCMVDFRFAFTLQRFPCGMDYDGSHAFAAKGRQFADQSTGFFIT